MGRAVRTPLARKDLKEIGRYIAAASGSRDVALRFLGAVERKIATYASQPELGARRPDLAADVRSFPVGSYLVFYRLRKRGIEVLRVLHGSRNIPSIWRNQRES